MAGTLTIPLTTLNDGTRNFGPSAVADTDVQSVLTLDRTVTGGLNTLTAATTVEVSVDQSNDGGSTWFPLADAIFIGGLIPAEPPPKGPGGNAAISGLGVRFAPGTGRRTRATVTTSGGPVAVQGTLTTS